MIPMVILKASGMTQAQVVGTKGQVVVEKAIRDQLGVKPGWQVMQRLVDGHVGLYFATAGVPSSSTPKRRH